jgi:hypothetical protein
MKLSTADAIPIESSEGSVDVAARLRSLAGKRRFAALATLSAEGPHQSLVAFALTPDLRVLIFATPRKTRKYRNILADGRVSLLLEGGGKLPRSVMDSEAISLVGQARALRRGARRDEYARLLLDRHPELASFLAAPSTALIAVELRLSEHVEDFQRVSRSGGD